MRELHALILICACYAWLMESAETARTIAPRPAALRSRVTNGRRVFAIGGDGNSAWTRRWKDLVELHTSDLGGPSACSEALLSLCRRIATSTVELERLEARMSEGDDTVDLDVYNRLAGNLRRMIESIGTERRARPVSNMVLEHFSRQPERGAK